MKLNVKKNKQLIRSIDLASEVEGIGNGETIFVIGRSPNALIHLDDKQISREHANLIYRGGNWSFECLTDKNISHNGDNVSSGDLKTGDELVVGAFTLEIEIPNRQDESSTMFHFDFSKKDKAPPSSSQTNVLEKHEVENDDLGFSLDEVSGEKTTSASKESQPEVPAKDIGGFDLDLDSGGDSPSDLKDGLPNSIIEEKPTAPEERNMEFDSEFQDENANDSLDLAPLGDSHAESADESSAENALGDLSFEEPLGGLDENLPTAGDHDESYSLDNLDDANDDGTKVIQSFASIELVLFGENAPYDRYRLEAAETFIGRDPKKCQIVLNDSEVSGVHAVIRKTNVTCVLEDLNSSNGTLVNGERINRVTLNNNDEFLIGGVSFTVKFRSDFLKQEAQMLMPVETSETVEVEEVVEIPAAEGEELDAFGEEVSQAPQEKSIIKRILKDEASRKKAIYALVGLVAAWAFLMPEEEPKKEPEKKPQETKVAKAKDTKAVNPNKKNLTADQIAQLNSFYQFGRKHFLEGRYREAIEEFEKVIKVDPNFNDNVQSQLALAKEGLKKLEDLERQKQKEIEEAERKAKVEKLLKEAREFVQDKRIEMAEARFSEISLIDPDNIEVPRLKLDIENWRKEIQRKELEETQKKAERQAKVQKLQPGKALFAQKEWFKAIIELEKFLKIEDMDDDLRKEGETMFDTSKAELANTVNPLLGKARSLVEGQDLKGAYETYYQILKYDPSNSEALNQTTDIKEQLTNKARKIYREAIISESLSLFQDAKEKFQEVQQITPVDSEYYKKATDKLKNYLD